MPRQTATIGGSSGWRSSDVTSLLRATQGIVMPRRSKFHCRSRGVVEWCSSFRRKQARVVRSIFGHEKVAVGAGMALSKARPPPQAETVVWWPSSWRLASTLDRCRAGQASATPDDRVRTRSRRWRLWKQRRRCRWIPPRGPPDPAPVSDDPPPVVAPDPAPPVSVDLPRSATTDPVPPVVTRRPRTSVDGSSTRS